MKFNVGDFVFTKEVKDCMVATWGKITAIYSNRYSLNTRFGESLIYYESELELDPQLYLFDLTWCNPNTLW